MKLKDETRGKVYVSLVPTLEDGEYRKMASLHLYAFADATDSNEDVIKRLEDWMATEMMEG